MFGKKEKPEEYELTFSLRDTKDKQELLFQMLEMNNPSISYR